MRQLNHSQRIESLVLTGQIIGRDAYKLRPLLPYFRVLTLKNLTTGQADSLLSQIRDWSRLERLTVDIAQLGPGRPNPSRLISLPTTLRRFRHLRDLRIREDGLNWAESLPVLASMTALRRLEIDRWQSQPRDKQPVLSTLVQLTALHLRNSGWLLTPETVGELPRLAELNLSSLQVDTGTLEKTLNQLTKLETLRLTKCWQVVRLSLSKVIRLKTVELAYNDKLNVDAALLAGMTHVERLTIKGAQAIDLMGVGDLRRLRYLNVMGNGQPVRLPETISRLHQLTDLRLYNVRLGSLPASFGLLRRLQTLHLNQCGLDSLPTTFGQLRALQDVTLTGNKLQQLTGIEQLIRLQQLNVSGNQLRMLPNDIRRLTQLSKLNLSENQLTELPVSLTQLVKLKQLVADHNRLERLPDQLGRLGSLTDLAVGGNQLTQLPASLSLLTSLTALSIDYNRLESLPDGLGQLRRLRFLSLDKNRLTVLPNSIENLDSLRFLWIGQNQLRALPTGLSRLRSLTELRIDDNELNILPIDIGRLQKLTVLALTKLPITELPTSVGALANLLVLSITDTHLRSLPDSIGALTNLQFVRLTNNALTTLPSSIGRWQAVTTMDLTGNPLERLPDGIGRMANLTELIIDGKQQAPNGIRGGNIRQLPDSIIYCNQLQTLTIRNQPQLDANDVFTKAAQMKSLSNLSVVHCNVVRLPDVAWKEVAWHKLDVSENQLTELPLGLLNAPNLQFISAGGNRLPTALNRNLSVKQTLWGAFAEAGKLPLDSTARPNGRLTEVLLRTANEKASSDDWAGALSALSKAIAYAPDSMLALPYGERSSLYYGHKQYADALADLDSAIAHIPQLHYRELNGPAILEAHWKWKGYIFAKMGQYDAALASLAQAEKLLPADPFPKYAQSVGSNEMDRGRYLALQGNFTAAESSYRKAVDAYEKAQRSHVGIRLRVVEICLLTGQYDRAQRLLNALPNEQLKQGYDTVNEYLRYCLALLSGNQISDQILAGFSAYCADHPQTLYWPFTLTDTWLAHQQIDSQKITAFRDIQRIAQSWLIQPR